MAKKAIQETSKAGKWVKNILVWGFVLAGVLDLVTALIALPLGREANPIYLHGGLAIMVIAKIAILVTVPFLFSKAYGQFSSEFWCFLLVAAIFLATFFQLWGASTNIQGIQNKEFYESLPPVSVEVADTYYREEAKKRYVLPLATLVSIFLVYSFVRDDVNIKRRFK